MRRALTASILLHSLPSSRSLLLPTQPEMFSRLFSSTSKTPMMSISEVLKNPQYPPAWPYAPSDFSRQDETDDSVFYNQPRFVAHIDPHAIEALTGYYKKEFVTLGEHAKLLDICSSWISHYPTTKTWQSAVGSGMVEAELQANPQLDSYTIADLNAVPKLPYDDDSFDAVTCCVSYDYMTKPLEVMTEIARVLKPGGKVYLSQSNRCFPSKAVSIWLKTNDIEHAFVLGSFFHYSGNFLPAEGIDLNPNMGRSDPLFVVKAVKK